MAIVREMNAARVQIRKATQNDAWDLACLHAEIFPGDRWTTDWFAQQARSKCKVIFMAEADDTPVGMLVLSTVREEGEVLTLGVLPAWRRQKIAAHLLEAAIAEPVQHLFLEVAADNEAALFLYRSMGFVENGLRPNYYATGADAILMMRTVS